MTWENKQKKVKKNLNAKFSNSLLGVLWPLEEMHKCSE